MRALMVSLGGVDASPLSPQHSWKRASGFIFSKSFQSRSEAERFDVRYPFRFENRGGGVTSHLASLVAEVPDSMCGDS